MNKKTYGVIAGAAFSLVLFGAGVADAVEHGNGGTPPGHAQDTTKPQPPSKADFSGHGANKHGPYDSTRDGSPSANGNGGGEAVGKPCAGCVGKADNKNPRGQLPGGSDANAGYECDRNHGVGRGNPAHTACVPDRTPPATNPPVETPPPGGPRAEVVVPAVVPVAAPVAAAAAPRADVAVASSPSLAKTGFEFEPALLTGLGLLTAGGAAVFAGTRRRRDA
ncbi:LPXTG cell wall anchor domain-containing protein [Amycolatopsis regifaucium]|uniref:LPXTG cell wall anchor domain-containing protein n=1 Tax=Amycolatopsis regifaucium TaxID=546365 RepID=UPI0008F64125|nr:LPXTG cell wall anchor domain-containing protein [Amycolatopsis regifaucium]SFH23850.1 LPXTG-motif cell wall anchor domain-containing protein [Amycolatopsis regifaucium]